MLLIGISGSTCSGKTSLAQFLKRAFRSSIVHQDDFYLDEENLGHVRHSVYGINWDVTSAFDMSSMMETVNKIRQSNDLELLIVEGITIYDSDDLNSVLDLKFLIKADRDVCKERRHKKKPPGRPDPHGYFDKIAWPAYEDYERRISNHFEDIITIDGDKPLYACFETAVTKINQKLGKNNTGILRFFRFSSS